MIEKINVLDHGFVRLVDSMGGDLSVVQAARVSYAERWKAGTDEGQDGRLLRYLWKNRHTSPFEAVTLKFEVKAPIFVFRQWHRHRTWSYNELSGRYRALVREFYQPEVDVIGQQSMTNKQGRDLNYDNVAGWKAKRGVELDLARDAMERSFDVYEQLLANGWPRELARSVLPVATYSHMEATVNLLNLFRFLTLRCDEHAQWEIRQYANALRELARTVAPVSVAAWEEFK